MELITIFWFFVFYLQYLVKEEKVLTLKVNKVCYSCPASDTPYLYKIAKAKSLSETMIKFLENSHTKNQKLLIEAVTKMDGCFALRHYKAEEPKNIEICTLISLKV